VYGPAGINPISTIQGGISYPIDIKLAP